MMSQHAADFAATAHQVDILDGLLKKILVPLLDSFASIRTDVLICMEKEAAERTTS